MKNVVLLALVVFVVGCPSSEPVVPEDRHAVIGTGGATGVYYHAGSAIAGLVNAQHDLYRVQMRVEETAGSVANVKGIQSGEFEFGILQDDVQYRAFNGLGDEWEGRPQLLLRSLFSLHAEAITIVATEESGIKSVADLRGKRVNIGRPGSGNRVNSIQLLSAAGINWQRDIVAREEDSPDAPDLLTAGKIDAIIYTVGHPNDSVREATASVRVRFVEIEESILSQLLTDEHPYYRATSIPTERYPDALNENPVQTIGVWATVCSSEGVPEDLVYTVTREVFRGLDKLRGRDLALADLDERNMIDNQGVAPIHPGALRYFREEGLVD